MYGFVIRKKMPCLFVLLEKQTLFNKHEINKILTFAVGNK